MIMEQSEHIIDEVSKAFMGKEDIIKKTLMAIYAGGHILLEDVPGVGKTTLALAFSKAIGLEYKRIQFTTDTLPSDITGFMIYNNQSGKMEYKEGAANCNLLLADEINRTSPKTQSALLEVMEEHSMTVDGITHKLPDPFICIATQNPVGTIGTQRLPQSQLDRFMIRLSVGYPDTESQMEILKARSHRNPLEQIQVATTRESILEIQRYLNSIHVTDDILKYAIHLCEATREHPMIELGISPREIYALIQMAKANAILESRTYLIPEDVQAVFSDVCAHRLVLSTQARIEGLTEQRILEEILEKVKPENKVIK